MVHNPSADYLHINIAISILATIGVVLRYLARWHCTIGYGLDDLLILVGWTFLIGLNVASAICRSLDPTIVASSNLSRSIYSIWLRWDSIYRALTTKPNNSFQSR